MTHDMDARIQGGIIEKASDWYVRHREGGLTTAEKARFLEWLEASLQHTHEYLEIARLSGGFKAAIADLGLREEDLLREIQATRALPVARLSVSTKTTSRARVYAIAASLLIFLGVTGATLRFTAPGYAGLPRTIAAARGEQRTVRLHDGSVMHVNANSTARIRYSGRERLIELDEGQAMFEVARDPRRPFRVRAGVADVVAIGTQFDVYRRPDQEVTVTVVQGKVDVVSHSWRASGGVRGTAKDPSYRLGAGEQVRIGASKAPSRTAAIDARAATAWVRREIIFEGAPLGEVADEFNRYVSVPIEIEDPSLRSLKVNGVFNAYDIESFIVFLEQYSVTIDRREDRIRVRR